MMPMVELTQEDMAKIFAKWNEDSEKNDWSKNPLDPKLQAEQFFQYAETLQREGKL
jgi:hypothetical protein